MSKKIILPISVIVSVVAVICMFLFLTADTSVSWEAYDDRVNQIFQNVKAEYNTGDLNDTYFMGCTSIKWAVTDSEIVEDDASYPMRQAFEVYPKVGDFECYVSLFYSPETKSNYYLGSFLPNAAKTGDSDIKTQTFSRLFTSKGMVIEVLAVGGAHDEADFKEYVHFVDEITNFIQERISTVKTR